MEFCDAKCRILVLKYPLFWFHAPLETMDMSSIGHYLKTLLSHRYRQEVRTANRHQRLRDSIDQYLKGLPQCHSWVLIASRADHDEGFHCDVTMRARDLLPWARENASKHSIQNLTNETVTKALPLWLDQASVDTRAVCLLPPGAFREIAGEIDAWASEGLVRVFCPKCRETVKEIEVTKENEGQAGEVYYWWTDVWTCQKGHVLRKKNEHMRIMRVRHRL